MVLYWPHGLEDKISDGLYRVEEFKTIDLMEAGRNVRLSLPP